MPNQGARPSGALTGTEYVTLFMDSGKVGEQLNANTYCMQGGGG